MLASVGVDCVASGGDDRAVLGWGQSCWHRVRSIVLASGGDDHAGIGWGRSYWHRVGSIVLILEKMILVFAASVLNTYHY